MTHIAHLKKCGLVKYNPEIYKYTKESMNSLSAMRQQIIYESGIPGLHIGCVWVGDGLAILSWVLPDSWRGPPTKNADEQLKRFWELAHITFEQKPRMWASTEGDMPPILRGATQLCGEIAVMQVESSRYWQPMPQSMPGSCELMYIFPILFLGLLMYFQLIARLIFVAIVCFNHVPLKLVFSQIPSWSITHVAVPWTTVHRLCYDSDLDFAVSVAWYHLARSKWVFIMIDLSSLNGWLNSLL